jgi:Skp family chaperone for outer membrane proteins
LMRHDPSYRSLGLIISAWGLVLLLAFAPHCARAEGPLPIKIGVVDVEQITRRSSSIRASIQKAEKAIEGQKEAVDSKMKELQRHREALGAQRSVLSEEEILSKEKKIRALKEEIFDLHHEINKHLERIQSEVIDPELKRIMGTVEAIARRERFDLILPSEAVLFHTDRVDISPLVIQELDRRVEQKQIVPPGSFPSGAIKVAP